MIWLGLRQAIYGKDIYFDIINLLILTIITVYAIKFYKLKKENKKYRYLIGSFSLLAISFMAKVISHLIIYETNTTTRSLGIINITYQTITQSNSLIYWGLFTYKILSLIGIYLFFLIYNDKKNIKNKILTTYLLLIVAYLGQTEFYIYHITMGLLSFLIIYDLIEKNKTRTTSTKSLIRGFGLILISQILFTIIFLNKYLYMTGETIQLIGYLLILIGFSTVIKSDGKKKR